MQPNKLAFRRNQNFINKLRKQKGERRMVKERVGKGKTEERVPSQEKTVPA